MKQSLRTCPNCQTEVASDELDSDTELCAECSEAVAEELNEALDVKPTLEVSDETNPALAGG